MSTTFLTEDTAAEWDALLPQFDGAWFYHLRAWREFVREVIGPRALADLSFTITIGTEIVALCPVTLEAGADAPNFTMVGGAMPLPAFRRGLAPSVARRAEAEYFDTLAALAAQHGAARAVVGEKFPGVRADAPGAAAVALARAGFFDLSHHTQIIDLTQPADRLWSGIRKGHRSDIKRAQGPCAAMIWDAATITPAKIREYQALHAKDAGRVTRSERSFDLMGEWVRSGLAVLAEVTFEARPVAFAIIMFLNGRAYYGSSCQDPNHTRLGASHLLQWEVMQWLAAAGVRAYDIGLQHFTSLWHHRPSPKDITIADFKRGFGGETVRVATGEYFYSLDALAATVASRLEDYRAARTAGDGR